MTRRAGHDRVLASIHQAADLGFDPVKVNVVVMRGVNDDEVADFVELTRERPINVSGRLETGKREWEWTEWTGSCCCPCCCRCNAALSVPAAGERPSGL